MDSVQDMQQYVQKAIQGYGKGTQIPFVVVDQQTNKIVGSTRLYNISVEDKTVELGTNVVSSKCPAYEYKYRV